MNGRPSYDELVAAVAELQAREIKRSDLPMKEIRHEVLLGEPLDPNESFVPHGIGYPLLAKDVGDQLGKVPDLEARVTDIEQNPPTPEPPEAWHVVGTPGNPAYEAGWGTLLLNEAARFYKHDERVYLGGAVTRSSGTSGHVFTLPIGYRPLVTKSWAVSAGGTTVVHVAVVATGVVSVTGAASAYLDGVSFRVT